MIHLQLFALIIGLSLLGLILAVGIDVLTNPVNIADWKAAREKKAWEKRYQKQFYPDNKHRRAF